MTKTIVFIHGFMNNNKVWTDWKSFFEERGYKVHAPSWPYLDGDVANLQQSPNPALAQLTFSDVVSHYQDYIATLTEKPILIGHSLGGVIVQKLEELDCAAKAVCVNSGPPKGLAILDWNFIVSNLQLLNPLSKAPTVWMSDKWYHTYVTNDLTFEETKDFRARYTLPSSKQVSKTIEAIDFAKPHALLLFIAGGADKSQPAKINLKNAKAYTDKTSQVDYKCFAERTHNILNQTGWQDVADYICQWVES